MKQADVTVRGPTSKKRSDLSDTFHQLREIQEAKRSVLCVGLDSDISLLPERFLEEEYPQFAFNQWIIEQTHEHVCCYKPNLAFYEANGVNGLRSLELTMRYLGKEHPDILTIADAKRGDIGNTAKAYAVSVFEQLGFDMVTVNPYLGHEALVPFLGYEDRGVIVVVKTSNPGGGELQDLQISLRSDLSERSDLSTLWECVLELVDKKWNEWGNCAAVIGATYPDELKKAREVAPKLPFLVPGVGAQGGSIGEVMTRAFVGWGSVMVNSSRGVIFAPDPHAEVKRLVEQSREAISN